MANACFLSPVAMGLSIVLLLLLCYAAIELIRVLMGLRILVNRLDRLSDIGRLLDWFRKKR
jgi:hypothetical protein